MYHSARARREQQGCVGAGRGVGGASRWAGRGRGSPASLTAKSRAVWGWPRRASGVRLRGRGEALGPAGMERPRCKSRGTGPLKGPWKTLAGPGLSLPPCVALSLSVLSHSFCVSLCFLLGGALSPRPLPCPVFQSSASLTFLWALAPWLSLSRPPRVRLCEVLLPRRGASRHQRSARQPDHAGECGRPWGVGRGEGTGQ